MKSAVQRAKLGREEELGALKQLDEQAWVLERYVSGPSVEELIADERRASYSYIVRSVEIGGLSQGLEQFHVRR